VCVCVCVFVWACVCVCACEGVPVLVEGSVELEASVLFLLLVAFAALPERAVKFAHFCQAGGEPSSHHSACFPSDCARWIPGMTPICRQMSSACARGSSNGNASLQLLPRNGLLAWLPGSTRNLRLE